MIGVMMKLFLDRRDERILFLNLETTFYSILVLQMECLSTVQSLFDSLSFFCQLIVLTREYLFAKMIEDLFRNCYQRVFPGKLVGDSRQGQSTLLEYQHEVSRSEEELNHACNGDADLFRTLRNDVMNTFSFIDNLVESFMENATDMLLFESEKDATELISIVSLDMKKAVLDYALQYVFQYNACAEKRRLAEKEEDLFSVSQQSDSSVHTSPPPGHQSKKRRPNLPSHAKSILSEWFQCHVDHPYPSQNEKQDLSLRTGLSIQKVDNWFINERSRKWSSYRRK